MGACTIQCDIHWPSCFFKAIEHFIAYYCCGVLFMYVKHFTILDLFCDNTVWDKVEVRVVCETLNSTPLSVGFPLRNGARARIGCQQPYFLPCRVSQW